MSILDKLGYGGITTVIGLLIVFTGLAIIIGCLYAMAGVFKAIDKKKVEKLEAEKKAAEAAAAQNVVSEPEAEEKVNDDELIAVIAAAIAAYDFGGKKVAIKSVRRVNASGWKNAARNEQIYKF